MIFRTPEISHPNCAARIEKVDDRISVSRFIIIAKISETTVTELVGEKENTVVNQNTERDAFAYFQPNYQADSIPK